MKSNVSILASMAALLLASPITLQAADPPGAVGKPNILFIVADDMGYYDCGIHGCKDIPTPNIDALAKSGINFPDGYVTGCVCSPSRCALMTGRYQQRDGVPDWIRPGSAEGLNAGVPTIANYLQKAGYRTALIGKWHLGEKAQDFPMERGFDNFYGFLGGERSYFPYPSNKKVTPYNELLEGHEAAEQPAYTTFGFGQKAVDFISAQKGAHQPFFLYLAFNAVHDPLQAPQDYLDRFASIPNQGRRTYAGMLSAMDDTMGKVLQAVRDAGVESNTVICFISDNGGPITRNAPNHSRNDPLRGGKGETWEGGIRVPFCLVWNGHLPVGKTFTQPVIQMDLTATVLALAGGSADAKWPMDGVNLLPYLTGDPKAPHPMLCWEYGEQWAIREGAWKLTYALASRHAKIPTLGLYNLDQDVSEQQDISSAQPERVVQLKTDWAAWRKDVEGNSLVPKVKLENVNESP